MPQAIEAIEFLSQYLTERRRSVIDKVLLNRTRHLTVVLEDVFKPQNASAVLRTCECLGIQDLYIIENEHIYEVNPDVVKGAAKWLTLFKYPKSGHDNTKKCFDDLRQKGYKIVAADPGGKKNIRDLDITPKTALVLGTEYHGLSGVARKLADQLVTIPMYGFTESYNLSVSAAICLEILTRKMRDVGINRGLTEEERNHLKLDWYKGHIRNAENMLMHQFGGVVS